MEAPFIFGKLAVDKYFTNRKEDITHLTGNFKMLVNTILISPRRWGKSSLVEKASKEILKTEKNIRFCFIDAFNVRTEEQFYQLFATEVLKASSSRFETMIENASSLMGRFIPRLSFNPGNQQEISLALDWKEVKKQPDDILNMAEKIASKNKWKFIICVDEFQNIATFNNHLAFQKKLRASWQKHQNTAYCLYGSKRHMLIDVFSNTSMPFYKFGDLIFLEKIKKEEWIKFIVRRFKETKKVISKDEAGMIATIAECHPYYVQQLAQQSWLRTDEKCSKEIIQNAHESIIDQLSLLFYAKTEELTNYQINLLKAVLEGVKQFSSRDALEKYDLGTSPNVIRLKKALESKEIIDLSGEEIKLLDPMYKSWLETRYFKMKRA
jgi:uncharacterized protein